LRLHLVETSPALRAQQSRRLPLATWHERMEDLPDGPMLLLANEFLDALPIRQFIRREAGWCERWVAEGAFCDRPTTDTLPEAPVGTIIERCESAGALAAQLARRFADTTGAALFLDYGSVESASGDSLQALAGGKPVSPLVPPGSADLTAHVDFATFATAGRAAGAAVYGPVPQGVFLTQLGLFQRTERLARGRPAHETMALIDAARRLAEPARMGRLFKALVLCNAGLPIPAGFES
jgi:SAM-dependent MidA family methyltransferase